jgi:NAD(P)-dependent dehydrogenase (short-subunit alcohol dehydrogenase family)
VNKILSGQTAILSGGLGDIGRSIALELARAGATVAFGDTRPESAAGPLLEELGKLGAGHCYDLIDVSDAEQVRAWVARVEHRVGVPTLIIPNAAIVTLRNFREIRAEEWARELRVNMDGVFHLAQAAAMRLLHFGRPGRIVVLGSWAGHRPHVHIPAYCVAKAGLRMLVQCMALEFAPHGILVNEVAPGYVDAGLTRQVWEKDPSLKKQALAKVPVRRLIQPIEVARQVVWLCHPDNLNQTGSTVLLDGGLSLLS